jgi:hypothetical protein
VREKAVRRWVMPLVCRPKEGATDKPALRRKLPVMLLVLVFYAYQPCHARHSASLHA